ncbi:disintegrin and metalloproteinase domain-containing protein 12 [Myotis lucifugus]|nr:disintegrin and metalloproteinase domain-containing protein 12 [Myotis lucifugus]
MPRAVPGEMRSHVRHDGCSASLAGAKPAPGICFERVNSAGDPYGNCGKDAKSSFAKCETRDAKCGKIQCQGGASRPVIGTNAVSIETNIPLQEGGRVLCRGTHVYLGDDMPDPGLVLAGTKCADGKICLNRRCQNISVFGVHECARQCHGRGVCNNRKNCHCEAHWAPPFCDKVGFGGSTDSGPIRQAGHRGLTAGVLASILCLLAAGLAVYLKRKTLVRLLFTDKKTLEKLRCVRPARPPGGCQPSQAPLAPLSQGVMRRPAPSSSATDNPKRPPQCQNVAISRPLQALDRPRPPSPQRVLPTLHQAPRTPSVPARPLPATPALRQAQVRPPLLP